jgi:uncharacterized protein
MDHNQNIHNQSAGLDHPLPAGFHLMAKPAGPACNLACDYCFYREKKIFFSEDQTFRMSDEILEAYTREYIKSQPGNTVVFEWQGGEPTLAGLDFFQRALILQKKYNVGKQISNSLQTNGTLIDDEWCTFLKKNNFLVGLSLDGPEAVHNAYRKDKNGHPTFNKVFNALKMMQEQGVEVNVLAAVNRKSGNHPLEIYRFLREADVRFIQFIPIVERNADPKARQLGIPLAVPPSITHVETSTAVTPWSVEPNQYGEFLIRIYDEWIAHDVGEIFVMNFEWTLGAWAGVRPGMCHISRRCGQNLIMEHNGDIYSCDHFMYPAFRLGNILEGGLVEMVNSPKQIAFGVAKETALPGYCRCCDVLFACRGGCPKHRFTATPDGEPGLNYLCPGFKDFFHHAQPSMEKMLALISQGNPVKKVMEMPS